MKKNILFSAALILMLAGVCPVMAMVPESVETVMDDDRIFDVVEENAQFPGGEEACMKWLRDHVRYPSICVEQGVQGRVIVSFVVNRDGSIVDAHVMRSPDQHLSDEALRVVNGMPKWKPARFGNKMVRSRFNLPIMFRLSGGKDLGTVIVQAQEKGGISPRGIYRLMWLDGKNGGVTSPWDQYKICTDDATLTLRVWGNIRFSFARQDDVFNYTGEKSSPSGTFAPRIYDSSDDAFTLKWWSEYEDNPYFPYLDWCKEHYESNVYSSSAKPVFDMLCAPNVQDRQNPLMGVWHRGKVYSDLKAAKEEAKVLMKDVDSISVLMKNTDLRIFGRDHMVSLFGFAGNGFVDDVEYNGKKSYTYGRNFTTTVTWISDDCIVIFEERSKGYWVLVRHADTTDAMSLIRSYLMNR